MAKVNSREFSSKIEPRLAGELLKKEKQGKLEETISGEIYINNNPDTLLQELEDKYTGFKKISARKNTARYDCPAKYIEKIAEHEEIWYITLSSTMDLD